jgi:hypothetical protein
VRAAAAMGLAMAVAHGGQALPAPPDLLAALHSAPSVARGMSAAATTSAYSAVVHAMFSYAVSEDAGGSGGGSARRDNGPAFLASYAALAVALHTVPGNHESAVLFRDLFRCLLHDALMVEEPGLATRWVF